MKSNTILIFLICFISISFSQMTGKIKGVVLDGTGDPLPHANVTVEGTTLGAEVDEDGYYYIIGVKAGTYTIKAQFVGYEIKEMKNVKVRVGLTTSQDFKLKVQPYYFENIECKVPSYFKYNLKQQEIELIKEELNLLPDELNDDKILSILNSDQYSFLLQEILVSKIKDQNVLNKYLPAILIK